MLQQEDLRQYNVLLQVATESKIYRPTLYDFLAHTALEFYKTDENSIPNPAYKFEIDNSNLLGEAKTFSEEIITSKDSTSLQAITLLFFLSSKDSKKEAGDNF